MSESDYRQTREHAVMFDVSDRALVQLTGPDARKFLHNLCTNDILGLAMNAGCEAFLATAKAKAVAYFFVHRLTLADGTEALWLNADPGMGGKIVKHLDHYLISEQVEIADRTAEFAHCYLGGAEAANAANLASGGRQPPEQSAGDSHVSQGADAPRSPITFLAHDLGTLPGFDVFWPREQDEPARQMLIETGGRELPSDFLEILRFEAGIPVFGKDIDEDRFVVEVGRGTRAICYTKGCYLGQEPIVMARDRGHVNRTFLGLKIAGEAPAQPGEKVLRDGQEVGQVTSSVVSPRFGPIALAYLRRGNQEPGTTVQVGERTATVAALPFDG